MSASPDPARAPKGGAVPRDDMMRRLQIGVGGVLIILLLVAMAGLASDRARENVNGAVESTQDLGGKGAAASNNAPLEELGVQPVTVDGATASSSALPSAGPMGGNGGRGGVPDLEPDPALERARQYNP